MNSHAPIALFVYNRFTHVKKVIEAIKKILFQKKAQSIYFLTITILSLKKVK